MSRRLARCWFHFLALLFVSPSGSWADIPEDSAASASTYRGTFHVDSFNPASTTFETLITNQEVLLRLRDRTLSTTVLQLLGLSIPGSINCRNSSSRECGNAELVAVSFERFQVWLDGCNVTQELILQCNASNCWEDGLPRPTMLVPQDASLEAPFAMSNPVRVNDFEVAMLDCPESTLLGLQGDDKHDVEFREALNVRDLASNVGGRVDYEIRVLNRSVSAVARTNRE
ncbi:MAG: hypothetical protein IT285_13840 [Bdellovibrionales bacterium]|nr:hypothetical protein [Bdellovibrionales bacterium]